MLILKYPGCLPPIKKKYIEATKNTEYYKRNQKFKSSIAFRKGVWNLIKAAIDILR